MRIAGLAFAFAAALCLVTGEASAKGVKLTVKQVKTVCGKQLQTTPNGFGCGKPCGKSHCDYGCVKKDGKTSCKGTMFREAVAGAGVKGPGGGILDSSPGLGTQGPASTGAPLSSGRASSPGKIN
jgi:hypothetical protein